MTRLLPAPIPPTALVITMETGAGLAMGLWAGS